jgi:hypothetical protein
MSTSVNILETRGIGVPEAIAALNETPPGTLVVFAGAGISVASPACCPTFDGLLEEILSAATAVYSEVSELADRVRKTKKSIKPELFFQILHRNMGTGILGCLDTLLLGGPNANHRALARLGCQGAMHGIITTNFDIYTEEALNDVGCKYEMYFNSAPTSPLLGGTTPRRPRTLYVVKPHGSLHEASSITITLRQAGRQLSTRLDAFLRNVLRDYTLLVIGYSGNDDDIFPLLKSCAGAAHRVFWTLYEDRKTLDEQPNVQDFARACATCKLVLTGKMDLLPLIKTESDCEHKTEMSRSQQIKDHRNQRLSEWASRFSPNAWANSFCELLLLLGNGEKDVADLVAKRAGDIVYHGDEDQLLVANALRNNGLAQIAGGHAQSGRNFLSDALQRYLALGRPREIVEVAVMMVENAQPGLPFEEDKDPLTFSSRFVQDDYSQGLLSFATGLELLRESKFVAAERCLLIAGGYALEAGDTMTLSKSVTALQSLYANPAPYRCEPSWRKQLPILQSTLSALGTPRSSNQNEILGLFQDGARRHKRLLLKLETIKYIGITFVCWVIAVAIGRSPVGAIKRDQFYP